MVSRYLDKSIKNAIVLFVSLQIYFASNTLSFGFWKSNEYVFEYMLMYYGALLVILVLLFTFTLILCCRLNAQWFVFLIPIIFCLPFAFELWVRSLEIENRTVRYIVSLILLPVMYLYFRIGISRIRAVGFSVLFLCLLSFFGHAGIIFPIDQSAPSKFELFHLSKKPNIHVIMLDAFTHSQFTREFLGIGNAAADALENKTDSIYAGTLGFAEHVPTRAAWGTLFNLGLGKPEPLAMSGIKPSHLAVLLKGNGYSISTGFSNGFFGWQQGKWVDNYNRGGSFYELKSDLVCVSKIGRLDFCSGFSQSIFSKLFVDDSVNRANLEKVWPNEVLSYIDEAEKNMREPLFSAFHIYLPGHTILDFISDDEEMVQEFKIEFTKGLNKAKVVIEEIDQLRKRHPNSIFIISGDHGPYLSRTASKTERRFIVLDRHGVALSMLNASNLCPWARNWLDEQQYLTPSRMLVAALVCDNQSKQLTEHFLDNEEFIRFGRSFEAK